VFPTPSRLIHHLYSFIVSDVYLQNFALLASVKVVLILVFINSIASVASVISVGLFRFRGS
jgi:hypothetical protein